MYSKIEKNEASGAVGYILSIWEISDFCGLFVRPEGDLGTSECFMYL